MKTRVRLTVLLVGLSAVMAFLPSQDAPVFRIEPNHLVEMAQTDEMYYTVDQVARFVTNEDTSIQIIDLRSKEEYLACNIPGSINIPYAEFLQKNWQANLNQPDLKTIFYSNDTQIASYAWTIATGLAYENNYIMQGGMNEWFKTVMLSEFSGEKISARENSLFENRLKARNLFTQLNSMPDSLKLKFLEDKKLKEAQLDGGCE